MSYTVHTSWAELHNKILTYMKQDSGLHVTLSICVKWNYITCIASSHLEVWRKMHKVPDLCCRKTFLADPRWQAINGSWFMKTEYPIRKTTSSMQRSAEGELTHNQTETKRGQILLPWPAGIMRQQMDSISSIVQLLNCWSGMYTHCEHGARGR